MRLALIFVACATLPGMEGDASPAAIAARILNRTRDSARTMPRYACIETITRDYYAPLAPVRRSCELLARVADQRPLDLRLRRVSTDRLRLDVAMAESGEMHSWVGESRFEVGRIDRVVTHGPIGSGAFGGFLATIFAQDAKQFNLIAQLTVDGRRLAHFSFAVGAGESHYKVKSGNDWVVTPYSGTFEADTETGEMTWVEVRTAILPPAVGTCQTISRLDLRRTALGNGEFLIATRARQRFIADEGGEVINTIQFSGCREYRGDSTIRYEAAPGLSPPGDNTPAPLPQLAIPWGQRFSLELTAAIDSATAAAGDPFRARLAASLTDGHGKTIAPRGSRVEGRILRVQTFYGEKPEVILVLRPQSVSVRGVEYPLAAVGDVSYAAEQQRPIVGKKKGALIILPYRSETTAGLFRFPGEHAVVKRGFVSRWRTQ
jgi:hypothetical protein